MKKIGFTFYKNLRKEFKISLLIISTLLVIISIFFFSTSILGRNFGYSSKASILSNALYVNASSSINSFNTRQMLGVDLASWEHIKAWGKPFPGEVVGLSSALNEINSGLIRYAGGLKANYVGFDRTNQRPMDTSWTNNGQTYYETYGVDEMASLHVLQTQTKADVMIQVNISTYDPTMWADMVKYTNLEQHYNFKYWELGNETDMEYKQNKPDGLTPEVYASRVADYTKAMKAVDPTIKIIANVGVSDSSMFTNYSDAPTDQYMSPWLTKGLAAASSNGTLFDSVSWHWYIHDNSQDVTDMMRYQYPNLATNSWRNSYSRIGGDIVPQRMQNEALNNYPSVSKGITEINYDARNKNDTGNPYNGNHLTAVWFADELGRLAYNGLNYSTIWLGYASQSQAYPLLYHLDSETFPTAIYLRPTYYTYYMYSKFFGNSMVKSSSFDNNAISIWASKDTNDPSKLKLMVTNVSATDISTPVVIDGYTPTTANSYTLKSTDNSSIYYASNDSMSENSKTSINGIQLHAMTVAQDGSKINPVPLSISGNQINHTYPAYSTTAIVLDQSTTPSSTTIAISTTPVIPTTTVATTTLTTTAATTSPTTTIATTMPTTIMSTTSQQVTTTVATKKGDFNNDNNINIQDLSILLGHLGATGIQSNNIYDLNKDNSIDVKDLSILLSLLGK